MSYVVTEKCLGERYATCVAVCPVDCMHPGEYKGEVFLVIDPEECIDCGACLPECPIEAIVEDGQETLPFEDAEPVGSDFTPWTGLGAPESELEASAAEEQPTDGSVIDVEDARAVADDGGGAEPAAGDEFRFEPAE